MQFVVAFEILLCLIFIFLACSAFLIVLYGYVLLPLLLLLFSFLFVVGSFYFAFCFFGVVQIPARDLIHLIEQAEAATPAVAVAAAEELAAWPGK